MVEHKLWSILNCFPVQKIIVHLSNIQSRLMTCQMLEFVNMWYNTHMHSIMSTLQFGVKESATKAKMTQRNSFLWEIELQKSQKIRKIPSLGHAAAWAPPCFKNIYSQTLQGQSWCANCTCHCKPKTTGLTFRVTNITGFQQDLKFSYFPEQVSSNSFEARHQIEAIMPFQNSALILKKTSSHHATQIWVQ
jgi:hypothetical protein